MLIGANPFLKPRIDLPKSFTQEQQMVPFRSSYRDKQGATMKSSLQGLAVTAGKDNHICSQKKTSSMLQVEEHRACRHSNRCPRLPRYTHTTTSTTAGPREDSQQVTKHSLGARMPDTPQGPIRNTGKEDARELWTTESWTTYLSWLCYSVTLPCSRRKNKRNSNYYSLQQ